MNQSWQAAIHFFNKTEIKSLTHFGAGNINDTWLLCLHNNSKFILQRINPDVFPRPDKIIDNMRLVTAHLSKNDGQKGIDKNKFQAITLCQAHDGTHYFRAADNSYFRLITYIPDSITLQAAKNNSHAFELGKNLGTFHVLLQDLDPESLYDTLPGFHITPQYLHLYDQVSRSLEQAARPDEGLCYNFIEKYRTMVPLLEDNQNSLRKIVIHGDPKVANFLFDQSAKSVISLIDLDTVKPGLLLHDIGDALRSCCNPDGENPEKNSKVLFVAEFFRSWFKGYLTVADFLLTDKDRELIVAATFLMTFELGIRFFTDHLSGNIYFKERVPGQNLQRALVQFQLAASLAKQQKLLEEIVQQAHPENT